MLEICFSVFCVKLKFLFCLPVHIYRWLLFLKGRPLRVLRVVTKSKCLLWPKIHAHFLKRFHSRLFRWMSWSCPQCDWLVPGWRWKHVFQALGGSPGWSSSVPHVRNDKRWGFPVGRNGSNYTSRLGPWLLMVQKSQGKPPGMVLKPCNIVGFQLPTSTGERRISEPSTVVSSYKWRVKVPRKKNCPKKCKVRKWRISLFCHLRRTRTSWNQICRSAVLLGGSSQDL